MIKYQEIITKLEIEGKDVNIEQYKCLFFAYGVVNDELYEIVDKNSLDRKDKLREILEKILLKKIDENITDLGEIIPEEHEDLTFYMKGFALLNSRGELNQDCQNIYEKMKGIVSRKGTLSMLLYMTRTLLDNYANLDISLEEEAKWLYSHYGLLKGKC